MSSCAATRRASSTSLTLQQPLSLSPPHNLSVTPVTSCPWSRKSAAATDESTPPLIMTSTLLMRLRPPSLHLLRAVPLLRSAPGPRRSCDAQLLDDFGDHCD